MTAAYLLALLSAVLPPADAATICAEHASKLGSASITARYVQLTDFDEPDRQIAGLTYFLNSASRSRVLVKPQAIHEQIVYVDLAALADPINFATSLAELTEGWEQAAVLDPYWHVPTIDGDKKRAAVAGPWCGEPLEKLKELTGSVGAVLRVDQFLARAGADKIWNTFAGISATQAEFKKQLGVDDTAIAKAQGFTAANIAISGVTRKPRRVVVNQSPTGVYVATEDAAQDDFAGNPFHFPVTIKGQSLKLDAYEIFALSANGFWRVAIFDGAGNRADVVPDVIAKDAASLDGIIRPGISCYQCHTLNGGDSGIQPFNANLQAQLNNRGVAGAAEIVGVTVGSYSPTKMKKLIERAQSDHHDACEEATGLPPKDAVAAMAAMYSRYRFAPVSPELASKELGIQTDEFFGKIKGTTDPMLALLELGESITRGSWESSLAEALGRLYAQQKEAKK